MKLTRKNLIRLAKHYGFCREGRKSMLDSLRTNRTLKQIFDARMKRSTGDGMFEYHNDANFSYLLGTVRDLSDGFLTMPIAKTYEQFKRQFESIKLTPKNGYSIY